MVIPSSNDKMVQNQQSPSNYKRSDLYIYVHGLASSSRSSKALYLQDQLWNELQIPLLLLDLNQDNNDNNNDGRPSTTTTSDDEFTTTNFTSLTLSRQIEQVTKFIEMKNASRTSKNEDNTNDDDTNNSNRPTTKQQQQQQQQPKLSVTFIGSSLGALTVAWVTHHHYILGMQQQQQEHNQRNEECLYNIDQIILLAPAFHFLKHWLPQLGEMTVQQWKENQYMPIYHYGYQRTVPFHYNFVTDLQQYNDNELFTYNNNEIRDASSIEQELPKALLIHGIDDEVIPLQSSEEFIQQHPWIQFVPVPSDHSLMNTQQDRELLWHHIKQFLCESHR